MAAPKESPGPDQGRARNSAFDQSNVAGARTLGGIFGRELHALSFAKQFEDSAADGAAMEEMFDAALIADEPEPLVDQ
jgi:ABC-type enterochelin transport system substrate-binding protein